MWGLGLGSIFLLAVSTSLSCCDSINTPQGLAFNQSSSKIIGTTSNSASFQTQNFKNTTAEPLSSEVSRTNRESDVNTVVRKN